MASKKPKKTVGSTKAPSEHFGTSEKQTGYALRLKLTGETPSLAEFRLQLPDYQEFEAEVPDSAKKGAMSAHLTAFVWFVMRYIAEPNPEPFCVEVQDGDPSRSLVYALENRGNSDNVLRSLFPGRPEDKHWLAFLEKWLKWGRSRVIVKDRKICPRTSVHAAWNGIPLDRESANRIATALSKHHALDSKAERRNKLPRSRGQRPYGHPVYPFVSVGDLRLSICPRPLVELLRGKRLTIPKVALELASELRKRGAVVLLGHPGSGKTITACIAAFDFSPKAITFDVSEVFTPPLDEIQRTLKYLAKLKAALVLDNVHLNSSLALRIIDCWTEYEGSVGLVLVANDRSPKRLRIPIQAIRTFKIPIRGEMLACVLDLVRKDSGEKDTATVNTIIQQAVARFGCDLTSFGIALQKKILTDATEFATSPDDARQYIWRKYCEDASVSARAALALLCYFADLGLPVPIEIIGTHDIRSMLSGGLVSEREMWRSLYYYFSHRGTSTLIKIANPALIETVSLYKELVSKCPAFAYATAARLWFKREIRQAEEILTHILHTYDWESIALLGPEMFLGLRNVSWREEEVYETLMEFFYQRSKDSLFYGKDIQPHVMSFIPRKYWIPSLVILTEAVLNSTESEEAQPQSDFAEI